MEGLEGRRHRILPGVGEEGPRELSSSLAGLSVHFGKVFFQMGPFKKGNGSLGHIVSEWK